MSKKKPKNIIYHDEYEVRYDYWEGDICCRNRYMIINVPLTGGNENKEKNLHDEAREIFDKLMKGKRYTVTTVSCC